MARGTGYGPAKHQNEDTQAASGGPNPIGYPTYSEVAFKLLENGYEPLPLRVGEKRPAVDAWTTVVIDEAQVLRWIAELPNTGVGLRTGHLLGIDIDVLDPEVAHQMSQIVEQRINPTLMRVGLWPKRLYLARTDKSFAKRSIRKLELLGKGQQFVAFGIHPSTRAPYYWATDDTPLDVPLSDLPLVDEATCDTLLAELASLLPPIGANQRANGRGAGPRAERGPVRDAEGLVCDGRDSWLSITAFHAVHDAVATGLSLDADDLADQVWRRFSESTDLARAKKDGHSFYSFDDARGKVRDKLALFATGRLPPRGAKDAIPVAVEPGLPVAEARKLLAETIAAFCSLTEAWLASQRTEPAPRIGVRATVGLGKSAVSRKHLIALQARLKQAWLPHRLLVFVQSLALADEASIGWVGEGVRVAVHRGYEAMMPGIGLPMCRDLDMVRMAVKSGLSVFPNACMRAGGGRCHNFELCAKQDNLKEVQEADIVLAAYDSLFTGLSINSDKVALMVIDEGCWERASRLQRISLAEVCQIEAPDEPRMADQAAEERAWEDLFRFRRIGAQALLANGPGPIRKSVLPSAGLTHELCQNAAVLEQQLRVDPGLRPGLPQGARRRATERSRDVNRSLRRETLFRALSALLEGQVELDGRVQLLPPDSTGAAGVLVAGLHEINGSLSHLPILHLDATLRLDLARTVLPGLEVTDITAAAPYMRVTSVSGSFCKATLVEDPSASPEENRRRRNRLQECVDHVRWEAARVAPGRVLVVTYKQIEQAFAGIAGVETGHFKAIAGLDAYKDVALLIVIGRPLPGADDLQKLASTYLGHFPTGTYRNVRRGLMIRDGSRRSISVIEHEDPKAELLRKAVCDDEVIQAIGRGRGVNRTADNPLEVQVLADVALPLIHDRVMTWESIVPDVLQRMLLAGIAVDSPADAAALHPMLFSSSNQAKMMFNRTVFGCQNPIGNSYREMTLKSAHYLRGGRGRSWQRAWWLSGSADDARLCLEQSVGCLNTWILA